MLHRLTLLMESTIRLAILALMVVIGLPGIGTAQESTQPSISLAPVVGAAELPRDLSPWGMFTAADSVVKAVLIGLVIASFVTWTVWLAKTIELFIARRRVRDRGR